MFCRGSPSKPLLLQPEYEAGPTEGETNPSTRLAPFKQPSPLDLSPSRPLLGRPQESSTDAHWPWTTRSALCPSSLNPQHPSLPKAFRTHKRAVNTFRTDGLNSEGLSRPSELQQTPVSASRVFVKKRPLPTCRSLDSFLGNLHLAQPTQETYSPKAPLGRLCCVAEHSASGRLRRDA